MNVETQVPRDVMEWAPHDTRRETEKVLSAITIVDRDDGKCAIKDPVGLIRVKHGHRVVWTIVNESHHVCTVALRHFRRADGVEKGVARDLNEVQLQPWDPSPGEDRDEGVITARADACGESRALHYKYEIWLALGSNPGASDFYRAMDPDYEIWP